MESFKVYVEVGEYLYPDRNGWTSSTSQHFETIIQAPHHSAAEKIAQAQFGGPDRCIVRSVQRA